MRANTKLDPNLDLLSLLKETDELVKTANKHKRGLNAQNFYADRFSDKHSQSIRLIDILKKTVLEKEASDAIEAVNEIDEKSQHYFNVETPYSERIDLSLDMRRLFRTKVLPIIGISPIHYPTDDLFPQELVSNTREYIIVIARQASGCYDKGWYDASAVMLRRLLETLIIECFEKHNITHKIKNKDGNYAYLDTLITSFLTEDGNAWNVSRNTKQALPHLKAIGDRSAHSRHFTAKKKDIDNLKDDFRICLQELLYHSELKK